MNPLIDSSLYPRRTMVMLAALFVTVVSAHAQTVTVLHTFTAPTDGSNPVGGLIQDQAGNLYGTTDQGGAGAQGTVFKIDTSGHETVLHSFVSRPDGLGPEAGLVIDVAGNLYGTTKMGGSQGKGTIFKVDPSGNETVLHSFLCCPPLGKNPVSGLIFDQINNLYGTAQNGGEHGQNGTVFKINASSGTLTVLHDFNVIPEDGNNPQGTLFFAPYGSLFGTTYQGGFENQGTVFEINSFGNYRVLYNFGQGGNLDGQWPIAGVIMDDAGNLLGTTSRGGAHGQGTVFKIDQNGHETILHNFGLPGDGQWPYGGLAIDGQGFLYGTTYKGGAAQKGTVFMIDPLGRYFQLHSFQGRTDGAYPAAGVIVGLDGNLYGTTTQSATGDGTVFKLSLH